jgi:hypothetical protein
MKFYRIVLIFLGSLTAGNASASNWVIAATSGVSKIYVDTDSINRTGNIVSAWYRRDYKHPMTSNDKQHKYLSSKVLNYYNCTDNEIAAAQWITYEGVEGQGKTVSNERVTPLEYGDIPPGETGKPIFDFICKRAIHNR